MTAAQEITFSANGYLQVNFDLKTTSGQVDADKKLLQIALTSADTIPVAGIVVAYKLATPAEIANVDVANSVAYAINGTQA